MLQQLKFTVSSAFPSSYYIHCLNYTTDSAVLDQRVRKFEFSRTYSLHGKTDTWEMCCCLSHENTLPPFLLNDKRMNNVFHRKSWNKAIYSTLTGDPWLLGPDKYTIVLQVLASGWPIIDTLLNTPLKCIIIKEKF